MNKKKSKIHSEKAMYKKKLHLDIGKQDCHRLLSFSKHRINLERKVANKNGCSYLKIFPPDIL